MALPEAEAICRRCGNRFSARPTQTFLGFRQLKCTACSKDLAYPLSTGYLITYWIMLVIMTFTFVLNLRHGDVSLAGLLAITIIIALVKDALLRRQVARGNVSSAPRS